MRSPHRPAPRCRKSSTGNQQCGGRDLADAVDGRRQRDLHRNGQRQRSDRNGRLRDGEFDQCARRSRSPARNTRTAKCVTAALSVGSHSTLQPTPATRTIPARPAPRCRKGQQGGEHHLAFELTLIRRLRRTGDHHRHGQRLQPHRHGHPPTALDRRLRRGGIRRRTGNTRTAQCTTPYASAARTVAAYSGDREQRLEQQRARR